GVRARPERAPGPHPGGCPLTDSGVLLFSAGLDSFPAWHYLGRPPVFYADIRHRYRDAELTAIHALRDRCGMDVTISTELDLSAWQRDDVIIPLRNLYLAMLASRHADTIWCV